MNETPLLMGEHESLFGICTEPEPEELASCGVLILNSGLLHRVGPYRLHVSLARALARAGIATIRLDQSGKGDSPPRRNSTFEESLVLDCDDAASELRARGADRIILLGLCSGADDAMLIAKLRDSIAGVVLLDGYAPKTAAFHFAHYRNRVLKPGPWLRFASRAFGRRSQGGDGRSGSPMIDIRNWSSASEMLSTYRHLIDRGIPIMAVFTGGAADYYNHLGQLARSLSLRPGSGSLMEIYYPEAEHTYPVASHREVLIRDVVSWVKKIAEESVSEAG